MNKIYIFYENKRFNTQIEYVFKTIFSILKLDFEFINDIEKYNNANNIIIYYGNNCDLKSNNLIIIKESILFSDLYLKEESLPKTPLKRYGKLPVIYSHLEDDVYIKHLGSAVCTNIDIIQSAFFMLSRYEEIILWDKIEKDMYDRFPSKESLSFKEGFIDIPIVNEYIEWLWQWIDNMKLGYKRRSLWNNHEFVACLTHDVDAPFKYTYSLKKEISNLKNKSIFSGYKNIVFHTLSKLEYSKDVFYTFDYIRKIEGKYNFTSSFYFMSGGSSNFDNAYKIDDIRILNLIKKLDSQGCEIGYHYSFNAYNNFSQMNQEKCLIDRYAINKGYGGRNHFLRVKIPETLEIVEKVGLTYDATLSYADHSGFRCGICMPYKFFDVIKGKELNVWEIPLIVMEGSLKDKRYMNFNCKEAIEEMKNKIDIVKKYNGVFTLLWHNSSFDFEGWNGWRNVFESTMKYLNKNGALGISGKEVISIFHK